MEELIHNFHFSNEAQFLETRKFQINEIARIFRVPPHIVSDEKSSFSNIEQQSRVCGTLNPWVARWGNPLFEGFTEEERKVYYVKFNVDGLLRWRLPIKNEWLCYRKTEQDDVCQWYWELETGAVFQEWRWVVFISHKWKYAPTKSMQEQFVRWWKERRKNLMKKFWKWKNQVMKNSGSDRTHPIP